ncbi:MAG: glycosyltransferase family 9 protein [Deltaproteobacteria bacterium]|nr:glycosyltransferase family 9 protein [Deltaproteobacteria bacterium]MBN2687702.1 glycosyltransferase family 9 protein [Deltaproteobacteria bacterium]
MNILIVKLSAIGDVVHTLPSVVELRKLYPDGHITWVVEEASSGLIMNHPLVDRVLVSRRKRWVSDLMALRHGKDTLREIRSFLSELRDRRYDLVIDFHGLLKSSVIVLLSRGKRKLGYDSLQELSGLFLTEKIFEDMTKHAVDRYLDFIRYLGGHVGTPEFPIPADPDIDARVTALLRTNGIDRGEPFVAINPVAYWETKLWTNEGFARLCDRIVTELDTAVVFTGGTDDTVIDDIRSRMEQPSESLEGQTTLQDLACLYKRASVVVSTDSGPMHIAAAMGTPTVALFGPTDPSRTGPYGIGHCVVRKDMPCSPCFLKKCNSMRCMTEITVEEVFEAVKNLCR